MYHSKEGTTTVVTFNSAISLVYWAHNLLENVCKVAQRSLRVTRVIDDNMIEKQPTNRLSNKVSELTNI